MLPNVISILSHSQCHINSFYDDNKNLLHSFLFRWKKRQNLVWHTILCHCKRMRMHILNIVQLAQYILDKCVGAVHIWEFYEVDLSVLQFSRCIEATGGKKPL